MSSESFIECRRLRQMVSDQDLTGAEQVLMKHRARLRRMVAARLDPRLQGRVDPSDIVQETYVAAIRQLPQYVRRRSTPVYPWLRKLAVHYLCRAYEQHVHTQKRSVNREASLTLGLSVESAGQLAELVAASGDSPSRQAVRTEEIQRVGEALGALSEGDREILILQFIEQLSAKEVADVLEISPEAVGMRRVRALRRISDLLGGATS